nr:inositol monophosphatase family protein [Nocardioides convexus]
MARLLPEVRDIRRSGSCAIDLCRVAAGSLDGYVEEGVHLWDHAAAGLVARRAGARLELLPGAGGRESARVWPGSRLRGAPRRRT